MIGARVLPPNTGSPTRRRCSAIRRERFLGLRRGLGVGGLTITAGIEQSHGYGGWHVSKQVLISTLDARLHTGELRFAKELLEAGAMQEELKDFRRKVSVAGRYTFEARVGKHDDLVLAVAIGLWTLVGRPVMPAAQFGTYS